MTSFDKVANKNKEPSLTFAELTKMLKDHDTYPLLINKVELQQMVRGCNVCLKTGRANLLDMNYKTYEIFIP